jgi:hypothetical protein
MILFAPSRPNCALIATFDEKTGTQLWYMLVYQNQCNERLEQDVQDVHITTTAHAEDGKALIFANERRKRFLRQLAGRSVCGLN